MYFEHFGQYFGRHSYYYLQLLQFKFKCMKFLKDDPVSLDLLRLSVSLFNSLMKTLNH